MGVTPYRILVTGSRDWTDRLTVYTALNALRQVALDFRGSPVTVIHGDCNRGADLMANTWALNNGVAVIRHTRRSGGSTASTTRRPASPATG